MIRALGLLCCSFMLVVVQSLPTPAEVEPSRTEVRLRFRMTYPGGLSHQPLDWRLLLFLSKDDLDEPRFQISDNSLQTQQVFGIDVEAWNPEQEAFLDGIAPGYPLESLAEVPPGTYTIQALLHRYETFHRSDGHILKLPMDRGEGQQWNRAPGNLYSKPRKLALDPGRQDVVNLALDQIIPPIADAVETKYIKHVNILSERLTKFWGRPMYLGAHILLPAGFEQHPEARYPLIINHGHFTSTFQGFREEPPDPALKSDFSERFQLAGYNRIEQEAAYQFFKDWTGPGFPRMLIVEIQHPNP